MSAAVALAEIDLIPAEYRNRRTVHRALRRIGVLVLALICTGALTAEALRRSASAARAELRTLQAEAVVLDARRAAIAELQRAKAALEADAGLVAGLRRDAALGVWLAAAAAAAPEGLWFSSWRAERLGVPVAAVPPGGEDYFLADGAAPPLESAGVRLEIMIAGGALDHAAVTAFVAGLTGMRGIRDVRLQRASRAPGTDDIEFELVAVAEQAGATE